MQRSTVQTGLLCEKQKNSFIIPIRVKLMEFNLIAVLQKYNQTATTCYQSSTKPPPPLSLLFNEFISLFKPRSWKWFCSCRKHAFLCLKGAGE